MSGSTSGAAHQHCLCHPPPLSSANKGGRDFRDRATVDASPVVIGDFEVLLDEAAEQAERLWPGKEARMGLRQRRFWADRRLDAVAGMPRAANPCPRVTVWAVVWAVFTQSLCEYGFRVHH